MDIQKLVNVALENTLADIYTKSGINTGDITPLQALKLDDITRQIVTLFEELIEQNKGENTPPTEPGASA